MLKIHVGNRKIIWSFLQKIWNTKGVFVTKILFERSHIQPMQRILSKIKLDETINIKKLATLQMLLLVSYHRILPEIPKWSNPSLTEKIVCYLSLLPWEVVLQGIDFQGNYLRHSNSPRTNNYPNGHLCRLSYEYVAVYCI